VQQPAGPLLPGRPEHPGQRRAGDEPAQRHRDQQRHRDDRLLGEQQPARDRQYAAHGVLGLPGPQVAHPGPQRQQHRELHRQLVERRGPPEERRQGDRAGHVDRQRDQHRRPPPEQQHQQPEQHHVDRQLLHQVGRDHRRPAQRRDRGEHLDQGERPRHQVAVVVVEDPPVERQVRRPVDEHQVVEQVVAAGLGPPAQHQLPDDEQRGHRDDDYGRVGPHALAQRRWARRSGSCAVLGSVLGSGDNGHRCSVRPGPWSVRELVTGR
jgi:hypothetical protein